MAKCSKGCKKNSYDTKTSGRLIALATSDNKVSYLPQNNAGAGITIYTDCPDRACDIDPKWVR